MQLPPEYLHGIELFNRGHYFECHEILESLWLKSEGIERELLHAIIQIAASLHHLNHGNLKGAASVWQRAQQRLELMPMIVMRLDTKIFAREMAAFFSSIDASRTPNPSRPQIHLNN